MSKESPILSLSGSPFKGSDKPEPKRYIVTYQAQFQVAGPNEGFCERFVNMGLSMNLVLQNSLITMGIHCEPLTEEFMNALKKQMEEQSAGANAGSNDGSVNDQRTE